MLIQAKLRELDIVKTNGLDYLGFDLDGQDSVKFFFLHDDGIKKLHS